MCGDKFNFRNSWDKDNVINKLEESGNYREARQLRHGDCIESNYSKHVINEAAYDINQLKGFDYTQKSCECEND